MQDDSSCTCEMDPKDERGGTLLVCLMLLFQLKVHGKELLWLWWWWYGCGVVGERVEEEGKLKEKDSRES